MRQVVLCNPDGSRTGSCDLAEAHRAPGRLHLAFSVFVFRHSGAELLIQQRHASKLFGSMWANSCCSHPRPEENDVVEAAERRLREEFGFTIPLVQAGSFSYQAADPDNRGAEHEFDTVLVGHVVGPIDISPAVDEIASWKWIDVLELERHLTDSAGHYAPWLAPGLKLAREL